MLCICKDWKCASLNNNLMWIYKLIYASKTSEKKTNEKQQKQWKKLPWTLANILVPKPWTFLLASFFGLDQLNFLPNKMILCKCHLKLAWIGFRSQSKGLGSNLWLSTNKIAPFCWTLPFGPHLKCP
jgi:hypothetical protein